MHKRTVPKRRAVVIVVDTVTTVAVVEPSLLVASHVRHHDARDAFVIVRQRTAVVPDQKTIDARRAKSFDATYVDVDVVGRK